MQANPGLRDAIPLGLGICWGRGTQGRPAVQSNPGLGGAIPLGLVICRGLGTQGRPAVQANLGLGDAIPLGWGDRANLPSGFTW